MNPILEEIMASGYTDSPNGEKLKVDDAVSFEEGKFLQTIIEDIQPATCLDIGFGYGISSLFICDALAQLSGNASLIAIDPKQFSPAKGIGYSTGKERKGIGLYNLERAGYEIMMTFYEKPSHLALPELEEQGTRIDFAFIDGWHTFDYTLLDFFYVDRILRVGGVVAIHDTLAPAIRKVCRFIITNRSYSIVPHPKSSFAKPSFPRKLIWLTAKYLPIRVRNLLKPEYITPDELLGLNPVYSTIAFKKNADYANRSYEHWEF